MKQFLKFLTKLKSFWKYYKKYGFDGETTICIMRVHGTILKRLTMKANDEKYKNIDVLEGIDKLYVGMENE